MKSNHDHFWRKSRAVLRLINEDEIEENLAKAAVQLNGYLSAPDCQYWALLHMYDEAVDTLSYAFKCEEYEVKSEVVRKLILEDGIEEKVAKAAVQVNGWENIESCQYWVLLHMFSSFVDELADDFTREELIFSSHGNQLYVPFKTHQDNECHAHLPNDGSPQPSDFPSHKHEQKKELPTEAENIDWCLLSAINKSLIVEEKVLPGEEKKIQFSDGPHECMMNDCAVIFPCGAVSKVCDVLLLSEVDCERWPKDSEYFQASPALHIHCPDSLQKPVTIRMRLWCVIGDMSDFGDVQVDILFQRRTGKTWEPIATMLLDNNDVVEFQCTHFTPFIAAVRKKYYRMVTFQVTGFLYSNAKREFMTGFCLDEPHAKQVIFQALDRFGDMSLAFNTMLVKFKSKIEICLALNPKIRTANRNIDISSVNNSFILNDEFICRTKKIYVRHRLTNEPLNEVLIDCMVFKNGVMMFTEPFYYGVQEVTTPSPRPASTQNFAIAGDYIAGNAKVNKKECGTTSSAIQTAHKEDF